jgi:hypothetical protein
MIRDLYIGRVAEQVGISRETLEREAREKAHSTPLKSDGSDRSDRSDTSDRSNRSVVSVLPFGARTEEKLLRVLIASPSWRIRAARELSVEDFDLPAFRAVFEALAALPENADVDQATAALAEPYQPVFQALREAAGATGALNLDREYEGAAEKLRDRAEFRRVYRIQDPAEKQRIMKTWGPEKQRRWAWQIAQTKARRARRH